MVHSVMAVSTVDKVKREVNKAADSYSDKKQKRSLFSEIFNQTVEEVEEQQVAPRECHTVTYGQDSRLRTFQYRQREYHY